jgi:hypothetical protein
MLSRSRWRRCPSQYGSGRRRSRCGGGCRGRGVDRRRGRGITPSWSRGRSSPSVAVAVAARLRGADPASRSRVRSPPPGRRVGDRRGRAWVGARSAVVVVRLKKNWKGFLRNRTPSLAAPCSDPRPTVSPEVTCRHYREPLTKACTPAVLTIAEGIAVDPPSSRW